MALQVMPYVHSPCRIGRGNPAAAANSGSECSGLRSPHIRYSSACCGDTGIDNSRSGARSGGSDEVDGPRSPPKPPSPRAKIERFCDPQRRAVRRGDRGLRPDHRGLALVPDVGELGDRAAGARRRDRAGHRDRLAGVQHPGELDVDARELAPTAARSCGSSPRHCRTSAAPGGCCRRGSAAPAGPSGRQPAPSPRW